MPAIVLGELAQNWLRVTSGKAVTGCAKLTIAEWANVMMTDGMRASILIRRESKRRMSVENERERRGSMMNEHSGTMMAIMNSRLRC